ncbi:uncharacterized protein LOC126660692 [Mercurialis annua]|uniref:uncharacterized protein LOC126660692 n=1 Tax=Mercurialis annua TaxID=3986 RepID=UPI00215FB377|nr:uncharacterized protein LOC126660692 [Mercurialis annua]
MGIIETSPTALASLVLKNLVTPAFIYADKSFINLGERYKLLEFFRYMFITFFLFILRLIASFLPSLHVLDSSKPSKTDRFLIGGDGDSGIARALSQALSLVNDIPVSSRKYEVVRSLAERIIEENKQENLEVLHEINRLSLAAAFARTLSQLEAAMVEILDRDLVGFGPVRCRLNRVLKAVWSVKEEAWSGRVRVERSEEKLAAELLWLAKKLADCGCVEEAAWRWASASNLGWLALSAEPRLQGSLVKVAAFLFKHAKDLGFEEIDEMKQQQQIESKKKMLMAWVPLLCRASNGTDVPVLSSSERAELERVLEELIEMLEEEEDQERVLSLWLHHFTSCPNSDWPNLQPSYNKWCNLSRKLLILR